MSSRRRLIDRFNENDLSADNEITDAELAALPFVSPERNVRRRMDPDLLNSPPPVQRESTTGEAKRGSSDESSEENLEEEDDIEELPPPNPAATETTIIRAAESNVLSFNVNSWKILTFCSEGIRNAQNYVRIARDFEKTIVLPTMWNATVGTVRREDTSTQVVPTTFAESVVLPMDGVVADPFFYQINPLTRDLFGQVIAQVGITRLCCAADIMVGTNNRLAPTSAPLHFLCSFVPYSNGQSSRINRSMQPPEHPRYWQNQMQWRTDKLDNSFCFMELAMYIYPCFLTHLQQDQQTQTFASNIGPVIPPNHLLLTVYKNYASVLLTILNNPAVKMAYINGWQPLFLAKNLLATKDINFGINRVKLTSCDRQNRSYFALVGFWKKMAEPNEFVTMSISNNGSPIVANLEQFVNVEE